MEKKGKLKTEEQKIMNTRGRKVDKWNEKEKKTEKKRK